MVVVLWSASFPAALIIRVQTLLATKFVWRDENKWLGHLPKKSFRYHRNKHYPGHYEAWTTKARVWPLTSTIHVRISKRWNSLTHSFLKADRHLSPFIRKSAATDFFSYELTFRGKTAFVSILQSRLSKSILFYIVVVVVADGDVDDNDVVDAGFKFSSDEEGFQREQNFKSTFFPSRHYRFISR